MKQISVLLADDHTIVREGLRKLLEAESDIEVVGEATTGRQAVALARELRPHVVVMDIAMPLLNGLEATRQVRRAVPDIRVIMLSAHADDAYVEQAMALGAAVGGVPGAAGALRGRWQLVHARRLWRAGLAHRRDRPPEP